MTCVLSAHSQAILRLLLRPAAESRLAKCWRDRPQAVALERPFPKRALRSTACYTGSVTREISQRELRNESGEIMRRLDKGETFVVTRNGTPVGELAPLRRRRFVTAEAARALFQGAPAVDLVKLRADLDEVASQSARPRA